MVTTCRIWGAPTCGHRHLQEPLQTPWMDLRPAEAVSEESSPPSALKTPRHRSAQREELQVLGQEPPPGPFLFRELQRRRGSRALGVRCAPGQLALSKGSHSGTRAAPSTFFRGQVWSFQAKALRVPSSQRRHVHEPLLIVQVGQRPPFATSLPESILKLPCDVPLGGISRKPRARPRR